MAYGEHRCRECGGPTTDTNEGRSFSCHNCGGEFINHGPWPTPPDEDEGDN